MHSVQTELRSVIFSTNQENSYITAQLTTTLEMMQELVANIFAKQLMNRLQVKKFLLRRRGVLVAVLREFKRDLVQGLRPLSGCDHLLQFNFQLRLGQLPFKKRTIASFRIYE